MCASSGFDRDDNWGHRDLEPARCSISSIALVLLKTGIVHQANGQVTLDQAQMVTAQKLLLFWRKPARKCWWDGVEVEIEDDEVEGKLEGVEGEEKTVKVWARRVWTLELNIVSGSCLSLRCRRV